MKFSSGIIYESTIEFGVEKYLTQRVVVVTFVSRILKCPLFIYFKMSPFMQQYLGIHFQSH